MGTIIDKIIADSKDDFEQAGLDQETLQELKQTWQKNITNLDIAHCPWDPPPAQQAIANPPTVPSNVKPEPHYKTEQSNSSGPVPRPPQDAPIKQEPNIKYEPNYPPQQSYGGMNPQFAAAQQRRDQLLQQQYGSQADASIQAAQARQMPMQGGHQRPTHIQMPPRPGQQSYPQQQSSLGAAQTDGASGDAMADWRAAVAERRAVSEQDRVDADHMLRDYLQQSAALDEGSLLLPASEQARKSKKFRKVVLTKPSQSSHVQGPGRFDGADEDDKDAVRKEIEAEEADEDAINSDLDDSDEELENVDEDDADGPMGETILCTYDKVQRVKNKWKCTLKDGILTTNKKEYVFHKAQGEFEW